MSLLDRVSIKHADVTPLGGWPHLPLSERVIDRLCDILYATDEIQDMIRVERRFTDERMAEVDATVRRVYDEVNELMKRIVD
jgi:hypothetical protein